MSHKKITTTEKQVIATMSANGQSINSMRRATGLHGGTIARILKEPATAEMIETAGKLLAGKMQDRIQQIVDAISIEDIEKATLRDKCLAIGILQDKCRQAYQMDKPAPLVNLNLDLSPVDLSAYR